MEKRKDLNNYNKKKIVYCGLGMLLEVTLILITVNILHLYQNEFRKELVTCQSNKQGISYIQWGCRDEQEISCKAK